MDAFRWLPAFGKRKGSTLADYLLATLSNPRLLRDAASHVLTLRSRRIASGLQAARRPELRTFPRFPASIEDVLAGLAGHMRVLVLERQAGSATIGVADVDLLSALVHLASAMPETSLTIAGEPATAASSGFRTRALAARQITARFTGQGNVPVQLLLESYRKAAPGRWISGNDENTVARAVYRDIFETPGITEVSDIIGGATLSQIAASRPIDVVYTWVNHADPHWQALYEDARGPGAVAEITSIDAENLARFHNKDELRYSLRSVAANLPWVRRIHVLTNCAPPAWLRQDDPRLVWVRHEDVMAPEHLPTFNSHVIESYLHHIPDLTEHFLYLNDDFFVMKPLGKEHFFDANGTSRVQLESYAMVAGEVRAGDADYLNAARNSARLIAARFGHVPTQLHRHVPYALRRSVLAEMEAAFADTFAAFRVNRFRRSSDLSPTSFLYHHYALAVREATLATCTSTLVKALDIRWPARLAQAACGEVDIVCINEGGDMRPSGIWERSVLDFMEASFPHAASWEV